jgi:ADP-ribose pyrophosphatase YjhB (NUDIX family)
MDKSKRPNVGIGVFIFNSDKNKFIIGKRIKEQLYGLPGGALEYGESFEESIQRETFEECGLNIEDNSRFEFICSFNCIRKEIGYHWLNLIMKIDLLKHEEDLIVNKEKDKCENWEWITLDECLNLKGKLFWSLEDYFNKFNIKNIKDIHK